MARLRSARIVASDLISTFPVVEGNIEADLCTIFGFAPNVDITASPFLCDNSGRITKDMVKVKSSGSRVGYSILDSSSVKSALLYVDSQPSNTGFSMANLDSLAKLLSIDVATGNLSGYTTQDTTNQALIVSSGMLDSTNFYNAVGQFSVPGNSLPFNGVKLLASAGLTVPAGTGPTAYGPWTEAAPGFDVGGHFDQTVDATKFIGGNTGKFMVNVELPLFAAGPIDLLLEIRNFASTILARQSVHLHTVPVGQSYFLYTNFSTLWHPSSSGDSLFVQLTNTGASDVTVGADTGLIDHVQRFNGQFSAFQVE